MTLRAARGDSFTSAREAKISDPREQHWREPLSRRGEQVLRVRAVSMREPTLAHHAPSTSRDAPTLDLRPAPQVNRCGSPPRAAARRGPT